MQNFKIEGQIREGRGKGPARRVRTTGMVPAVLYGGKKDAISLTVEAKQVAKILRSATGHNTIFKVNVANGGDETAMVSDWQVDPVQGKLLHVDLFASPWTSACASWFRCTPSAKPQGVKLQGGVFEIVTREVEVECLPGDIPEEFRVDISEHDDRQAAARLRSAFRPGQN